MVALTTKDAFANIIVDKTINHSNGSAYIAMGTYDMVHPAEHYHVARVYFLATKSGTTVVSMTKPSFAYVHDGKGTRVPLNLQTFTYIVENENVSQNELVQQSRILEAIIKADKTVGNQKVLLPK